MTTVLDPVAEEATPPVLRWRADALLAGVDGLGAVPLADHVRRHGPTRRDAAATLRSDVERVGLLGRGGAAFPVATKLAALAPGGDVRVVVNGSEGEPASWKDRVLMRHVPHLVLDGALVVAAALRTPHVTVAVRDRGAADALRAALAERDDAAHVRVVDTDVAFVGGEARSLVNGLSGGAPVPGGRRVLPTEAGVDGRPTFLSNVETFAQLGLLSRRGAEGHLTTGTSAEPGTTLVTVHGDVPHRGVLEVPHGMRVADLAGGEDRTVLLGGYHGTWGRAGDHVVDRRGLRAAGRTWGAGVVAVLPEGTCPLGEVARVVRWLAQESTGQCGPCVFGLASLADDAERLAAGQPVDLARLSRRVGLVRGRGACAHPDGAVGFLASALTAFADDVAAHVHGGCGRPVLGVLPVPAPRATGSAR
jgi:NADH:ubiquinone oxidoreductase subunit F (NADH-binding)